MRSWIVTAMFAGALSTLGGVALAQETRDPGPDAAIPAPDFQKKLDELELKQDELLKLVTSSEGKAKSFLGDEISIGGFFESSIETLWGANTKTQVSARAQLLGINLAADFNERFRFNSQIISFVTFPLLNLESDPREAVFGLPQARQFGGATFGTIVPQGYVEYSIGQETFIQAGLGYVPFGIAFQQFEPVLFRRADGPQLLSASGGDGVAIVSPVWTGLHLKGTFSSSDGDVLGYDAYTATPGSNPKSLGGGGRLWAAFSGHVTLGASLQAAKRDGDTYEAVGADLQLKLERFGMDAEYARNFSASNDPWTVYAEPYYTFFDGKILLYVAADYLDNTLNQSVVGPVVLADPYQQWEYGFGVNWLPIPYTRFRLGFLVHDYVGDTSVVNGQNRDYCSIDVSAGIAF